MDRESEGIDFRWNITKPSYKETMMNPLWGLWADEEDNGEELEDGEIDEEDETSDDEGDELRRWLMVTLTKEEKARIRKP